MHAGPSNSFVPFSGLHQLGVQRGTSVGVISANRSEVLKNFFIFPFKREKVTSCSLCIVGGCCLRDILSWRRVRADVRATATIGLETYHKRLRRPCGLHHLPLSLPLILHLLLNVQMPRFEFRKQVLFVSNKTVLDKVSSRISDYPGVKHIVVMEDQPLPSSSGAYI